MSFSAVLWPSNWAGIVIGSHFFGAFPFPITKLLQSGAEASMIFKSTFVEAWKRFQWLAVLFSKLIMPFLVMSNYLIRKVWISISKNKSWNKPEDPGLFSVCCDLMLFRKGQTDTVTHSVVISTINIPAEVFRTNVTEGRLVRPWSTGLTQYTTCSAALCVEFTAFGKMLWLFLCNHCNFSLGAESTLNIVNIHKKITTRWSQWLIIITRTTTATTGGRGKLTHPPKTGISPKHVKIVQIRHTSHGDTFICVSWAYL